MDAAAARTLLLLLLLLLLLFLLPVLLLLSVDHRAGKISGISESLTKRYSEEVGQVPREGGREGGRREEEGGIERERERERERTSGLADLWAAAAAAAVSDVRRHSGADERPAACMWRTHISTSLQVSVSLSSLSLPSLSPSTPHQNSSSLLITIHPVYPHYTVDIESYWEVWLCLFISELTLTLSS